MNDKVRYYINNKTYSLKSNYLKGYYNNIWFDSSWELSFIVHYENYIKRCDFHIEYEYNNTIHHYHPDFILNIDNKNILIEIKGRSSDVVDIKRDVANKYIEDSKQFDEYQILFLNDLKQIPGFILYNSKNKLKLLNKDKLQIKINCK